MGATKKRRQTKHRGNAAGMVEAPGRTGGRNGGSTSNAPQRGPKAPKPPSWTTAYKKAIIPVVILAPILIFTNKGNNPLAIVPLLVIAYVAYVPLSYASDRFIYNRYHKAPKPKTASKGTDEPAAKSEPKSKSEPKTKSK